MDKMMEIVLEKAYFEKPDVVKLIKMLPIYMQETAVLIAIGRYKQEDIPVKGIYKGIVYRLKEVSPFAGVSVVGDKDTNFVTVLDIDVWKKCGKEYQQCQQDKQKEYEEKAEKLCKDLHNDMFGE